MTTKKPRKPRKVKHETMKIPCLAINRIIEIKKLDGKEILEVITALKNIIEKSTEDTLNITTYIHEILLRVLSDDEKKRLIPVFGATLKNGKDKDTDEAIRIAVALYVAIVDQYPMLRIEFVCGELNGWIPESIAETILDDLDLADEVLNMNDKEFEQLVKKETSKKPSKKADKYNFSTLKSIEGLKSFLRENIIGQDSAIDAVCNSIKLKSVGFANIVSLFFIGPTGVGKSQVSKLLGEKYSGNFYQINCSDYSNGHEMNKLIGAPPGYIGHTEKSILAEKAGKSNKWVFLFDEIEKGHDKFFNWLLPLIDTGKTYDNMGAHLDFTDSIFIFTSNCGVRDIKESSTNFNHTPHTTESSREELMKSIRKEFSPEFRNRIDEFVFFDGISRENAAKISELRLKDLPIKRTPELIKFVCDNGFSIEYGARELIRFIKRNVALPLADAILSGNTPEDGTVLFDSTVVNGKLQIINTKKLSAK